MTTTEYQVTGMTCGHCENAVREEVSKIAGVAQVDVSAATGKLVITSANPLADTDVVAAVDEAGYEAVATGSA
ncbi:MAG: heavy-metal-associated domain-containing protein [Nocardioidaceae bacterium]